MADSTACLIIQQVFLATSSDIFLGAVVRAQLRFTVGSQVAVYGRYGIVHETSCDVFANLICLTELVDDLRPRAAVHDVDKLSQLGCCLAFKLRSHLTLRVKHLIVQLNRFGCEFVDEGEGRGDAVDFFKQARLVFQPLFNSHRLRPPLLSLRFLPLQLQR